MIANLPPLTPRQRDVFTFIVEYRRDRGYAPSLRNIGKALGMASTNGVAEHINHLRNKGYIARAAMTARGIVVLAAPESARG